MNTRPGAYEISSLHIALTLARKDKATSKIERPIRAAALQEKKP